MNTKRLAIAGMLIVLTACALPTDQTKDRSMTWVSVSLSDYFVDQSISRDSANRRMSETGLPFRLGCVCSDTYEQKELLIYHDSVAAFTTETYSSPEYISSICKIESAGFTTYRITISEDVVGLDYFILIASDDGTIYESDKFNENCEPYEVVKDAINLHDGYITVKYESGILQGIPYHSIKAGGTD